MAASALQQLLCGDAVTVIRAPPHGCGPGHLFGQPYGYHDAAPHGDGVWYLCYTARTPRGSTPADADSELRIATSADAGASYTDVVTLSPAAFGTPALGRAALTRVASSAGGLPPSPTPAFLLLVSYVHPSDGKWCVAALRANSVVEFDPSTATVFFGPAAGDKGFLGIKDPWFHVSHAPGAVVRGPCAGEGRTSVCDALREPRQPHQGPGSVRVYLAAARRCPHAPPKPDAPEEEEDEDAFGAAQCETVTGSAAAMDAKADMWVLGDVALATPSVASAFDVSAGPMSAVGVTPPPKHGCPGVESEPNWDQKCRRMTTAWRGADAGYRALYDGVAEQATGRNEERSGVATRGTVDEHGQPKYKSWVSVTPEKFWPTLIRL